MRSKTNFIEKLNRIIPKNEIFVSEPMSKHTSFRLGGPCICLIEPSNINEIISVIKLAKEHSIDYMFIGNGSDLLVSDKGLDFCVVKLGKNFAKISLDDTLITAQAGALNNKISVFCKENGLTGFEFASGIPGSIGGAAIMNAGAYEYCIQDICFDLLCLDSKLNLLTLTCEEADFSYRHSKMQDQGLLVLEVRLQLQKGSCEQIQAKIDEYTRRRTASQPLNFPSAGSTFKRPTGYYAGPLIQEAGMQGVKIGGAQVSEKHAGFIINAGGASAQNVYDLIKLVQQKVFETSGVNLEPEVKILGFD